MKDKFKMNVFFDEEGPTFEEIAMEAFEDKINEILDKYQSRTVLNN